MINYCCVQGWTGGFGGTGNTGGDPLFVSMSDLVGPDGTLWTYDDGLRIKGGAVIVGLPPIKESSAIVTVFDAAADPLLFTPTVACGIPPEKLYPAGKLITEVHQNVT